MCFLSLIICPHYFKWSPTFYQSKAKSHWLFSSWHLPELKHILFLLWCTWQASFCEPPNLHDNTIQGHMVQQYKQYGGEAVKVLFGQPLQGGVRNKPNDIGLGRVSLCNSLIFFLEASIKSLINWFLITNECFLKYFSNKEAKILVRDK